MNIDKTLVQNLIDETIGPEYEICKISDSSKYVFISWKHRDYYIDDERGHRIGVGPIVYNKTTKEYKLLGSGDLITGDYTYYINEDSQEEEEEEEEEFVPPNLSEIKTGILKREYVNRIDIGFLGHALEMELGKIKYSSLYTKDIDFATQTIVHTDSEQAINRTIEFWKEIDHEYKLLSPSKLLVWRVKKATREII